jgi:hypothetical protein
MGVPRPWRVPTPAVGATSGEVTLRQAAVPNRPLRWPATRSGSRDTAARIGYVRPVPGYPPVDGPQDGGGPASGSKPGQGALGIQQGADLERGHAAATPMRLPTR